MVYYVNIMKSFVDRFNELLGSSNINDLEKYLNLNNTTNIYNWRNGEKSPKLNNLIKIANYFECSLDYLLGRSDDFYEINLTPSVNFGEQLEKIIKEKGISKNDLVNNNIVSRTNLSDWKAKGTNPSMEKIVKLADYLGVSVDHLVGRE